MFRLAFKLGLSGRAAYAVHTITTFAVGAGSALLLFALSVAPATQVRSDRTSWMSSDLVVGSVPFGQDAATTVGTSTDYYRTSAIDVVIVAGTSTGSPVPPGIPRLPREGEAYFSPALHRLVSAQPPLTGRYGNSVGTIGAEALAGPDHLLVVRGVSPQAAAVTGTTVTSFPRHTAAAELDGVLRTLLLLAGVAVLAPIALFVAMATRLTSASRDERLARLRLAGAGPRTIRRMAGIESLIPGVGGVVLGLIFFAALRPVVARLDYDGQRWFTDDLWPGVWGVLTVVVAVPIVAALASQLTLRAVSRSPLASSARAVGRPVHPWRIVPLLLATPTLLWTLRETDATGTRWAMLSFAVLLASLILAGPWITQQIGVTLSRRGGPVALLAGRRLAADPRSGFRALGGVILAVLVCTLFVASTPAAVASLQSTTTIGQRDDTAQALVTSASTDRSRTVLDDVRRIEGIEAATLVYTGLASSAIGEPANVWIGDCGEMQSAARLTVSCADAPAVLADNVTTTVLTEGTLDLYNLSPRQVRPREAIIDPQDVTAQKVSVTTTASMPAEAGVDMPQVLLDSRTLTALTSQLRPSKLLFSYQDPTALEQARTIINQAVPASTVTIRQNSFDGYNEGVRRFYWLLAVGTTIVFVISSLGMVIAMVTGLIERRLPLSLLRATGAAVTSLRGAILLEAMVPLVALSLLAAVAGGVSGTVLATSSTQPAPVPWLGLLLPVTIGMATATVIVLLAARLVGRFTDTTRTRFE
ncbi:MULTISPECIES: ABC transporter permease [Micromonospora]|uniref:ABC3 transporter permease C-terminal domain-containing protein n=1 Tax=Micromonospora yangpuensis TaxID=683228 RepID=A0A1C6UME5_9ACTN|nr:FtsX-like permease family protein [Micromonospora yangpuensis]GGM27846.1 hypothetical protein GCM10012279_53050 [Micromonospora yangpuensis]SCL55216.1 hypothetical protein GA0070617_2895 [Micromonospora yangpuensis]